MQTVKKLTPRHLPFHCVFPPCKESLFWFLVCSWTFFSFPLCSYNNFSDFIHVLLIPILSYLFWTSSLMFLFDFQVRKEFLMEPYQHLTVFLNFPLFPVVSFKTSHCLFFVSQFFSPKRSLSSLSVCVNHDCLKKNPWLLIWSFS